MKYVVDNDLHIHTNLSPCERDPWQTPARILRYARVTGLKTVCVTDHFWDEDAPGTFDEIDWYSYQTYEHISQALPLPQAEGIRFLFGCETELDKDFRLGLTEKRADAFDFIVVPTDHLHLEGITVYPEDSSPSRRQDLYVERLDRVLHMDLPFRKVGLAHLTDALITKDPKDHLDVLDGIGDCVWRELFSRAAKLGAGVELNLDLMKYAPEDRPRVLRPYRIARACGCRFYLGSDAHEIHGLLGAPARFRAVVDALELTEEDKFSV